MNDTASLIERCLAQDSRAWDEFVERFSGLIYRTIRGRLSHYRYPYLDRDIDDIYQIVVTALWRDGKLASMKSADTLPSYIAVISSNAAIDFMRRRKKDIIIRKGLLEQAEEGAPSVEEHLRKSDVRDAVFAVLSGLTEKERMVLELIYQCGKTHKEAACTLNVPVNTVSTIVRRAKGRIREGLKEKNIF